MRIAVLSDIHANLHALEAVARDAENHRITEFWTLGDVVGYGANPRECLAWVEKNTTRHLQGNHDYAVATGDTSLFNTLARESALRHHGWLSKNEIGTLLSWTPDDRVEVDGIEILLAHGSPDDPLWEYVPVSAAPSGLARWSGRARIILMGHTHQPFVAQSPQDNWGTRHFLQALVAGDANRPPMLLANPGSVGQPRDGDPRASYAVLDTAQRTIELRRVTYDVTGAIQAIVDAGLPPALGWRLEKGL